MMVMRLGAVAAAFAAVLLSACAGGPPAPGSGAATFLIRGASVVDGTGEPARVADVRVRGDRIADVGRLEPRPGERVVEAAGLVLAPGFIDTHSHHDQGLLAEPTALAALSQGITTIVVGQDGRSTLPLADLFGRIEAAGVAVNVASYAGHGTIRRHVMGDDFRREATTAEVDAMRRLLRQELATGALGLSTGLEYDPGIYASTAEVIALAREAAPAGGRLISHVRSEDRALFDAVDELITIGREAAIPVQVSHMKLAMRSLWGRADDLIDRLERARATGVDVTADVYPYTYWQSTMTVLFPDRDFTDRAAAEFALDELAPPDGMLIARYEPEPAYEGRTLAEVARERGEDPVTTYLALIQRAQADDAAESIIGTSMAEADVIRLLQWPHTNVSSDGGLAGAHPRGFGAFTRVLGPWVRAGHLTLEQAVHRMSGLAGAHVGIADRGVIRPGAAADLVLFDAARVTDRATPERPHAVSEGIERVWVNGVQVLEGARPTGALPGAVIRRAAGAGRTAKRGRIAPATSAARGMPVQAIDSIFTDYDTAASPGCAVGVIRDGELIHARGYGMANLEHDVPLTPSSVFRIASVSKQFTAAAMVLLEQDGLIALDDPVRKHLPELPELGPRFTIRDALHHTSGVRDYLTLMSLAGKRDTDWYSDDDVVAILARQTAPNFEPGTDHLYSNAGYFLLSQIVKRVTGRTLADYARARMFEPLGMTRTHFHDDPTVLVRDRATGYAPVEGGGYRISTTTLPMIGDGGIFTSIEELVRWDRNLDDPVLGGPEFVDAMHTRAVLASGDTIDYALGLVHGTHRGLRTVGHGGAFVGFRAASLRYPDQRISIYTLCNRADANPSLLSQRVGETLLGDRMLSVGDDPRPEARPRERVDTLAIPADDARALTGTYYASEVDARYRIMLVDGQLRLAVGNWLDGPIALTAPDTLRRGPLTLRLRRDGAAVTGFYLDAGRVRGIRFDRLE
jgi:N-acyl-D-amino-acid deacylase